MLTGVSEAQVQLKQPLVRCFAASASGLVTQMLLQGCQGGSVLDRCCYLRQNMRNYFIQVCLFCLEGAVQDKQRFGDIIRFQSWEFDLMCCLFSKHKGMHAIRMHELQKGSTENLQFVR